MAAKPLVGCGPGHTFGTHQSRGAQQESKLLLYVIIYGFEHPTLKQKHIKHLIFISNKHRELG